MITAKEADTIITENIKKYSSVRVPLQNAFGMVLREDLTADRDVPPFNRVMMDGIGIRLSAWEKGIRIFEIEGIQKAGIPAMNLKNPEACLEVMTGAVLPEGCDCVIPIEGVDMGSGKAKLKDDLNLNSMQYVHGQASDHKAKARLVSKGSRLLAAQVAVAASVGKQEVLVSQMPKIAVVGTGDEVIGVGQKLEHYQIRQSNSYVIQAALELGGYSRVFSFHIQDNKDELTTRLGRMLEDFDVLILSGGVSRGKFDYIPEVLNALGVKELFHRVKQRPGKPLWFGKSKAGKPVFGLPGNPVSTQVGVYRYVLPFLDKSTGIWSSPEEFVSLDEDVDVKTDLTFFLPVKVESREDGRLAALPVFPNGSGDYAALTKTDGFIELPPETFRFAKGTAARLYRWKI